MVLGPAASGSHAGSLGMKGAGLGDVCHQCLLEMPPAHRTGELLPGEPCPSRARAAGVRPCRPRGQAGKHSAPLVFTVAQFPRHSIHYTTGFQTYLHVRITQPGFSKIFILSHHSRSTKIASHRMGSKNLHADFGTQSSEGITGLCLL